MSSTRKERGRHWLKIWASCFSRGCTLPCKAKRERLLACKASRRCLLALRDWLRCSPPTGSAQNHLTSSSGNFGWRQRGTLRVRINILAPRHLWRDLINNTMQMAPPLDKLPERWHHTVDWGWFLPVIVRRSSTVLTARTPVFCNSP